MQPELWAGVECSFVRIHDTYVDQVVATGHDRRLDDLDRLAALGVRAIRYPVLWEKTAPGRLEDADWALADERLGRLRELGIRPIVGLVHHGSGPRSTSLLEASFVTGLAAFARAVAERYPWVTDFTPVNEPLTTARFSALYGHWYPHRRDGRDFIRALMIECEAIRAAMAAIREVTPRARLIQTEDLATVFSTPKLRYQAAFENERRFLSLDLLVGRIDERHPLRDFVAGAGITSAVLDSFVASPCPPGVIGINYYVTSDRYLDEHVEAYPAETRGGNGRDVYCDVEAARISAPGIVGHRAVLQQMWDRYGLPLALTEVHLGCTPEEQIRWFAEAWTASVDALQNGIDVRAVTAWSVFGAVDWDSLLVEARGHYEPGLFDVRGDHVRPTALASVVADFARTGTSNHPMLATGGWWRHDNTRLTFAPAPPSPPRVPELAPLLIGDGDGIIGQAIVRACEARGLPFVALPADHVAVAEAIERCSPWAVVHAAVFEGANGALHLESEEGRAPARAELLFAAPTPLLDLGQAVVTMLVDRARGVWHLSNGVLLPSAIR